MSEEIDLQIEKLKADYRVSLGDLFSQKEGIRLEKELWSWTEKNESEYVSYRDNGKIEFNGSFTVDQLREVMVIIHPDFFLK